MNFRTLALTLTLGAAPFAAQALPAVGDIVGTNAEAVSAALEKAGCTNATFQAEGGVEAICTETATGIKWDVTIDPATGAITGLKESDE